MQMSEPIPAAAEAGRLPAARRVPLRAAPPRPVARETPGGRPGETSRPRDDGTSPDTSPPRPGDDPLDAADADTSAETATARGHVCPFCGKRRSRRADACPRCTMADSPATRRVTTDRVGPWFVLRNRTPSAPGMNFATLHGLAARGQVTRQSIVRGPTTRQLWTTADRMPGLARVLGVCHACAAEVDPHAQTCSHCSTDLFPPIHPDVWLADGSPPPPPAPVGGARTATAPGPAEPVRPASAASATSATSAASVPADAVLSARELAAAFRLDAGGLTAGAGRPRPRGGVRRLLIGLLVLTLLLVATLAVLIAVWPPAREVAGPMLDAARETLRGQLSDVRTRLGW